MPAKRNTHQPAAKKAAPPKNKSLESWIWDAACSIRGAKDAPKGAERDKRSAAEIAGGKLPDGAARRVSAAARINNFIPDDGIQRIAATIIGWKEEEKLSRIVDHAELKKNDYNISPSRYIHTSDAETYRPVSRSAILSQFSN